MRSVASSIAALALTALTARAGAAVAYVNAAAPPNGNGWSWRTAFNSLDAGIAALSSGAATELWVAAGTYVPTIRETPSNPRSVRFLVPSGAAIYGGFAGTEAQLDERDWNANLTILSGDVLANDGRGFTNRSDNAYHVVVASSPVLPIVVDGFVIHGGAANGAGTPGVQGGGMRLVSANSTIRHCRLTDNLSVVDFTQTYGGAAIEVNQGSASIVDCVIDSNYTTAGSIRGDNAALAVTDCTFFGNSGGAGTGIATVAGSLVASKCDFTGNTDNGTGMIVVNPFQGFVGSGTISECTFVKNQTRGVVFGYGASGSIADCEFHSNGAGDGGAIFTTPKNVSIARCDFANNYGTNGGAIFITSGVLGEFGTVNVSECTFDTNIADARGGAVAIEGFTQVPIGVALKHCTFRFNFSIDQGGAVSSKTATCSLQSCSLDGNWAPVGGGVNVDGGATSLDLVTIANNEANSTGGVRVATGTLSIKNSIIWGNSDGSGDGFAAQLSLASGATNPSDSCIKGWLPSMGGVNVIADDPRFADPLGPDHIVGSSDDDLSLLADSPCINRANLFYVPQPDELDVVGNPRRQACRVDMGAYESPFPAVVSSDCNDNGVPDECDLIEADCNGNGIPDDCDIANGRAQDCDGNGVPDSCQPDCDGDGLPDACEIAAGNAIDCDGDGHDDACQLQPVAYSNPSPQFSPFGSTVPATFTIPAPPTPITAVTLTFSARADLNTSTENVAVALNGTALGTLWGPTGSDCPAVPDVATIVVPASTFLSATAGGAATITMIASAQVNANQCTNPPSFITVTVSYSIAAPDDLDVDGILDACAAKGDLNGDAKVDATDLSILIGAWGPCPTSGPCTADIDGDGTVGASDLSVLLGSWSRTP